MVSRQSGVARPSARRRIVALTSAFGIGIAFAAPGDLDAGFGDNGLLSLIIGIDDPTTNAYSVVQQTDGKLVLAGRTSCDFAAVQLAADGTPDATFGVDGIATADFGIGETCDLAFAAIQQSDGKLVLAGSAMFEPATERSDIALARFNADGSLDATFGDAGRVTLDIDFVEHAVGLIQQANGKLVIAGTTNSSTNFPATARPFFARFNANGSLDMTFGSGGTTLIDFGDGSESRANSLAQQADGKLVAVGPVYGVNQNPGMGLIRLTADGLLDPLFDGDGMLTVYFDETFAVANAVVIQPDGAIVAAGSAGVVTDPHGFHSALLRVTGDGSLDSTFGEGGKSVIDLGDSSSLNSMLVLPDSSLVATGVRRISESREDMILVHFSSNGTLDPTYGIEGVATADFGIGSNTPFSQGTALIRQTDGKFVVVGPTFFIFNGAISAARFDDGAAHPGVVGLTATSQSVDEAAGAVVYTVRRTGGSNGTVSVDYATVAGQAMPGSDFQDASGTLTWDDGDASSKILAVDLIADSVVEEHENFSLILAEPTGGAKLAASEAGTTITNDATSGGGGGGDGGGDGGGIVVGRGGGGGGAVGWLTFLGLTSLFLFRRRPRLANSSVR